MKNRAIEGQNVCEGRVKGPGGSYRLACSDAGLVLLELPAKGRTASGFRDRLRDVLRSRRDPDAPRDGDAQAHFEWFAERVEGWDGEVAWEVFWRPPPLDLRGTLFRRKVWTALRSVPPGEILTYGQLAERSGSPRAARAVGSSMHENPAPLFVPCHRVVSSCGIGGFGDAGLDLKRELLAYEAEEIAADVDGEPELDQVASRATAARAEA